MKPFRLVILPGHPWVGTVRVNAIRHDGSVVVTFDARKGGEFVHRHAVISREELRELTGFEGVAS